MALGGKRKCGLIAKTRTVLKIFKEIDGDITDDDWLVGDFDFPGSQMTLEIRRRSKMLTSHRLPEIINEIGIGWYHIVSFIILVCMPLAEGAGMIVARA